MALPAMAMDPKNVFNNKADFKVPLPSKPELKLGRIYPREGAGARAAP